MRRSTSLIAGLAAVALALAPAIAEARAGDGRSMGSRGSNTYSAPPSTRTAPDGSQPMQRSMTQPAAPGSPGAMGGAMTRGGGFMSGLMGGLIGVGIGGLLFGNGLWSGGLGFGGFFGFLIQMLLVALLVRFLYKMFANRRRPAMAGGPDIFARNAQNSGAPNPAGAGLGGGFGRGGAAAPPPVQIGPSDYQQFEQLLQSVQAAWSAQDLNGLRAMATPEMANYFSEQLSEQSSRGVRNQVTDVRLVSGDLAQSWNEQGRDYATVAMRFSMVDVTRDVSGRVVDGNPNEHVTATELWTFIRSRGGQWILSAIQQTR